MILPPVSNCYISICMNSNTAFNNSKLPSNCPTNILKYLCYIFRWCSLQRRCRKVSIPADWFSECLLWFLWRSYRPLRVQSNQVCYYWYHRKNKKAHVLREALKIISFVSLLSGEVPRLQGRSLWHYTPVQYIFDVIQNLLCAIAIILFLKLSEKNGTFSNQHGQRIQIRNHKLIFFKSTILNLGGSVF